MKKITLPLTLVALAFGGASSQAAVFSLDFSPAGGALNLGSTTYTQDHAVGLSALNAVGQPASPATGGEIGSGLSYDDVTNILSYDFAYGSAFGFVDLAGDYTTAHFHGAVAVQFPAANTGAGVFFGVDADHTASGPRSGRITGTSVLSASQETDLFDNEIYMNIHSGFAGGGEIRGQLIVVPEPSAGMLLLPAVLLGLRRRR